MTDRSTPRSTGADSGVRLRRAVPEFSGWSLIVVGTLLAIVATAVGSGGIAAAALLAAGVALLVVARFDGIFGRVAELLVSTGIVAQDDRVPARAATAAPHHRATRALLGETVTALNEADPSSPWTIERDGSWSTAELFDYAIYRRHQGAPPERIAVEVDPSPGSDLSATALRIASSFSAGGGLYDAVLIVAADLDHAAAERLERLVSRLCGAPCVAVAVHGLGASAGEDTGAEILLLAEALEHVTSTHRASAPRGAATAKPARPAADRPPAPTEPPAVPVRREPALAWSASEPAAPRTPPAEQAPAHSDDISALLQQAEAEPPAPSRRSRSQR